MPNLDFDTGVKTFTINNDENKTILFCPSDREFLDVISAAIDKLSATQDKWAKMSEAANGDVKKLDDCAKRAEAELREIVDGIFEKPVCSDLFGRQSVYSLASGAPLWFNFLLAVIEAFDAEIAIQQKETNPKLQRLLKKYGKEK